MVEPARLDPGPVRPGLLLVHLSGGSTGARRPRNASRGSALRRRGTAQAPALPDGARGVPERPPRGARDPRGAGTGRRLVARAPFRGSPPAFRLELPVREESSCRSYESICRSCSRRFEALGDRAAESGLPGLRGRGPREARLHLRRGRGPSPGSAESSGDGGSCGTCGDPRGPGFPAPSMSSSVRKPRPLRSVISHVAELPLRRIHRVPLAQDA